MFIIVVVVIHTAPYSRSLCFSPRLSFSSHFHQTNSIWRHFRACVVAMRRCNHGSSFTRVSGDIFFLALYMWRQNNDIFPGTKYFWNRWTDLRQIHGEDVFGPSLGRVWMSRSKVKNQGHQAQTGKTAESCCIRRDQCLRNGWTDLLQIHRKDVFGPCLGPVWMWRSKVKGQGHQGKATRYELPSLPGSVRMVCARCKQRQAAVHGTIPSLPGAILILCLVKHL